MLENLNAGEDPHSVSQQSIVVPVTRAAGALYLIASSTSEKSGFREISPRPQLRWQFAQVSEGVKTAVGFIPLPWVATLRRTREPHHWPTDRGALTSLNGSLSSEASEDPHLVRRD